MTTLVEKPFFIQALAVWTKEGTLYTYDVHKSLVVLAKIDEMVVPKRDNQKFRWTTPAGMGYAPTAEEARQYAEKRLAIRTEDEWKAYCREINYRPT